MVKDFFMSLFNDTFQSRLLKLKQQGLSDEEIICKLEKFDFSKMLGEMSNMMSKDTVEYMESTMYEQVLKERTYTAEFMARQEQIWGKGFIASEAMYLMVLEAAQIYGEYLDGLSEDKKKDKVYHFLALRGIHARACQEFLEIVYLMKAGFADGAFARWRSMYELSVVAEFIKNNDESTAKSFIKASESEDKWHNWAKEAQCFIRKKGNVTFNDLQVQCDFCTEDWKKQYALANKVVHASSQGTFRRLGVYKPYGILPVGHSDYGVSIAAEHSAISLAIISEQYFTLFPFGDGIVHVNCIKIWVDVIRKYYFDAEDSFNKEDVLSTQSNKN